MRRVVSCAILLKANIVDNTTMENGCKKVSYHGAIGFAIVRNGCVVFILKEIWAIDVAAPQALPKSHS